MIICQIKNILFMSLIIQVEYLNFKFNRITDADFTQVRIRL